MERRIRGGGGVRGGEGDAGGRLDDSLGAGDDDMGAENVDMGAENDTTGAENDGVGAGVVEGMGAGNIEVGAEDEEEFIAETDDEAETGYEHSDATGGGGGSESDCSGYALGQVDACWGKCCAGCTGPWEQRRRTPIGG